MFSVCHKNMFRFLHQLFNLTLVMCIKRTVARHAWKKDASSCRLWRCCACEAVVSFPWPLTECCQSCHYFLRTTKLYKHFHSTLSHGGTNWHRGSKSQPEISSKSFKKKERRFDRIKDIEDVELKLSPRWPRRITKKGEKNKEI